MNNLLLGLTLGATIGVVIGNIYDEVMPFRDK